MVAAGQAMVTLVPIRIAPAFRMVDDVDAKNMGILEEEKEQIEEGYEQVRKQQQRKKSEGADFRADRKKMLRARKETSQESLLRKQARLEKRALPSFLKVRGGTAGGGEGTGDGGPVDVIDSDTSEAKRLRSSTEDGVGDVDTDDADVSAPADHEKRTGVGLVGYASDESSSE
eukprot:TRINITY_DN10919_c0_g2_i1.p1 TRINITY_DN10919_c0_g2~~TRINITY_DN10919_c0_g2_i1.p1  ORF type:complete len:173 (+),score=49.19 TRINITY_DN10919_c0_g2_i1:118-636(+)